MRAAHRLIEQKLMLAKMGDERIRDCPCTMWLDDILHATGKRCIELKETALKRFTQVHIQGVFFFSKFRFLMKIL